MGRCKRYQSFSGVALRWAHRSGNLCSAPRLKVTPRDPSTSLGMTVAAVYARR